MDAPALVVETHISTVVAVGGRGGFDCLACARAAGELHGRAVVVRP